MQGTHFPKGIFSGGGNGAEKGGVDGTGKLYGVLANTASTVGTAGAATVLPANPEGYLIINIGGTNYKLPYYKS